MAIAPNSNINIPYSEFLNATTGRPNQEWLMWLMNPQFITVTLGSALPVTSGGTGLTTIPTNGQLLIGNGTGYTLNPLTPGAGIGVTNGVGLITVANTGVLSWSGGSTGLTPATATTGAVTLAGTLGAGYGGTGLNTYVIGDILYSSGTTALSRLADVVTGNALISGGVATAPSWGKIGLTTHVSGTLPIANGGTNGTATATAGAISYGTGSAYAFTAAGTLGQVLTSAGAGTPTWSSAAAGTVTSVSVVSANGLAGTVATATTTPAITLSTTVTGLLKGNGTAISAATSGTDYAPATSGTSILYGNGSGGFSNVTIGTGVAFAGGTLSATGSGGTVTSVTGTAPVVSSGGATPAISMAAATTSVNGYLTSTDWNTFNGKQPAGSYLVSGGALGTPSSGTVTNLTGTASININGTVGATTANTGAFTTVTATGTGTFNKALLYTPAFDGNGAAFRNSALADTTNNVGLFQNASGSVTVNAPSGQTVSISNALGTIASITSSGVVVTGTGSFTGNVGIGTASPGSRLHIAESAAAATGPILFLHNTAATQAGAVGNLARITFGLDNGATAPGGNAYILAQEDGFSSYGSSIQFGVSNGSSGPAESMRISSAGNLGIANTSPSYKIDAIGSTTNGSGIVTTLRLKNSGTSGNDGAKILFTAGTSTDGAGIGSGGIALNSADLRFYTGGNTERVRIDTSGIVTMNAYGAGAATFSAAGVISSVSDETWKVKDGAPVDTDAMLNKLEPGYWYYNDEKKEIFGKDRQLGFYAQNVNTAIGPEAAPEPEDGKPWGYYDRSVLAVTVMSLQKALETIKELSAKVAALENKDTL